MTDSELYEIFSKSPNKFVGNKPNLNIYREPDFPKLPKDIDDFLVPNTYEEDDETGAISGKLIVEDDQSTKRGTLVNGVWYVEIAFTCMGDKGPLILFMHGVPTNRRQYYPIMNLLKPFCRCVAIDMLGMGESQVKRRKDLDPFKTWLWKHDADYIKNFMEIMYPNEKFIFCADKSQLSESYYWNMASHI